ncbi:hypothetical protein [Pseudomonas sp. S3_E10]
MKWIQPFALWTLMLLGGAFLVNVLGVGFAGNIDAWRQWLDQSAGYFRWWRMGLYAVLGYGAYYLYRSSHQQQHLRRTGIAAVLVLSLLELHSLNLLR